jgi:hypothetical protein
MMYKNPGLESELTVCHPTLRTVLKELDVWLQSKDWPGITLTHVLRTPAEQKAIYDGTEPFSWHMVGAAVDFRNRVYNSKQLTAIIDWLIKRVGRKHWEILSHDVGRGNHFHLAFEDEAWKREWQTRKDS